MAGKLIRMFLADGIAEGIKTLTLSNRTNFCTVFPRPMFEQFKARKENDRPGVYILVGEDVADGNVTIYIGEGDPVGPRLYSHYSKKDFWTDAIVLTSKDDYLTKTQIQYIESSLIKLAQDCNQVHLDNGNSSQLPNISEDEEAEVKDFLESLLLLIKALGYNFFVPLTVKSDPVPDGINTNNTAAYAVKTPSIIFEYTNKKGAHGKMSIRQGKYILLEGSISVKKEATSVPPWIKRMRKKLIKKQILVEHGENTLLLIADTEFKSPSGASSIIAGSSTSGFVAWIHKGQTLREYEQSTLD